MKRIIEFRGSPETERWFVLIMVTSMTRDTDNINLFKNIIGLRKLSVLGMYD